jgi:2-dehydropantoate 2-reductase
MKILIYGAGVIGSIYAARLYEAGCNVTLLARDKHYEHLKQNGVIIKDTLTGKQTTSKVPLTPQLAVNDFYDLIIVSVTLDQLDTVIPVLKANKISPLIMLMLNNPESTEQLIKELNPKHIISAFPGAGGTYQNNIIDYIQIKQQKTTIGEINCGTSSQIKQIKSLFESAGFKVTISDNMNAWLKTHAVFVACVAAAIIKEDGDSVQLGKNRSSVKTMVQSIREGFTACKRLGMPIAPTNLKIIFMIMPQWFSVYYWQKAMLGEIGTLAMAPHANNAKDEMKLIARKVLTIVHSSSFPTPTLDMLLLSFINSK